jgi:hypothetical protein
LYFDDGIKPKAILLSDSCWPLRVTFLLDWTMRLRHISAAGSYAQVVLP